jgi:membrane-bound metal-dependent hydrolase YbcI (DUF457 family)
LDNVTHTLFALTLARTPLGRAGRGTTTALVIASNAPDVDAVSAAGGGASYLVWHRGPTHGLLGIVGLGLVTAVVVWILERRRTTADADVPRATLPMLFVISMIGVLLHILMDVPTSYGTRLMSPFDWHWFAVDWMPIIDIYLWIALAAGLLFGRGSPDARRRNASIVLVFMAANYGIRGVAHHRALTLAPRVFGPGLPRPCSASTNDTSAVDYWPRPPAAIPETGRRCLIETAAMPTFLSPLRWRIVAHLSNAYELHDVDLLDSRFQTVDQQSEGLWRTTRRYPNQWNAAVVKAAMTRTAQAFLGFARFPAVRSAVDSSGITTVRWNDVRFVGGLFALDQPVRRPGPFAVLIRIGPDGQVLQEEIGP